MNNCFIAYLDNKRIGIYAECIITTYNDRRYIGGLKYRSYPAPLYAELRGNSRERHIPISNFQLLGDRYLLLES